MHGLKERIVMSAGTREPRNGLTALAAILHTSDIGSKSIELMDKGLGRGAAFFKEAGTLV